MVSLTLDLPSIVALLAVLVPVVASPDSASQGGFSGASGARLRGALLRGTLIEVEEIGLNLSRGDLSHAIRSPKRELALAGIAAARHAQESWLLLVPLADRASSRDRPIAAAAAEVAADIAGRLDGYMVAEQEIAADELQDSADAWLAIAERRALWPDIRVRGLEVHVSLARVLAGLAGAADTTADTPDDAPDDTPDDTSDDTPAYYYIGSLARDPEPEVRRAVFELLSSPLSDAARRLSVRALAGEPDAGEPDDRVALAAAQALCSELAGVSPERLTGMMIASATMDHPTLLPPDPVARVLEALGESGLQRIQELVSLANVELPAAGLLDAARCLAAAGDADSREALQALARRGPRAIRGHVRALLGTP